jgi:hypothetical protein
VDPLDLIDSVLFRRVEDSRRSSDLNPYDNQFDLYAVGYLRAGDILVDYILQNGHYMSTLVFPIVFNYRQYIELRLKEIIWSGRTLHDQGGRYPLNHNIADLWSTAKQLLNLTSENTAENREDYVLVETLLADFAKVDAASDAFRFPEDRDGKRHLEGVGQIDTPHIKEVMNKVSFVLDSISTGIAYYLECKHEQSWD